MDLLVECRQRLHPLVEERGLMDVPVMVTAGPLSSQEAIGTPRRGEFTLLRGREVMVEAVFQGSRGQAFSAVPVKFEGTLAAALRLDLGVVTQRAVYAAAQNAVLHHLGFISGACHCRDSSLEKCAQQAANMLLREGLGGRIGLVGYQPMLLEQLVHHFGSRQVYVSDLAAENIGQVRWGVPILDGAFYTGALLEWADALLVTGSTVVNGTAGRILQLARRRGIDPIFYGVTVAGPAYLLNLRRFCPEAGGHAGEDG